MMTSVLKGLAASPGTHVGRAVVADRPNAVVVQVGGVLVIKTSSMDWLEAIASAGAVVTEIGGRTSHAATICRELGKPCVTAVADVTSLISSGTWIAVDGGTGTVTILPA
jgi:phosphoenolpyruvate synthase/pyruvate phosphate dikinase